ncbi:MAG: DNA alkylation repair protein [Gemmatimonadota bacterium]|nr:DNA alkylation repair protein [Gemmatimonadota bacterium]
MDKIRPAFERRCIRAGRAVVRDDSYHALIETTIAALVVEKERFVQTGIGWVVSDLSKSHPGKAAELVERHFDSLSAEVVRRHTRHLPEHAAYRARKRGQGDGATRSAQ